MKSLSALLLLAFLCGCAATREPVIAPGPGAESLTVDVFCAGLDPAGLETVGNIYRCRDGETVAAAFRYYLEHYNRHKPFLLVGGGDGARQLLEMLQDGLPDQPHLWNRFVAAYLVGLPLPETFPEAHPRLRAARSAYDTGVIVPDGLYADLAADAQARVNYFWK